jgi:hypothetical protein
MPIFPVCDVAKYGVITDQDPYDLPTEAWSLACNVRFQNRKVTRGPVWRAVQQPLSESNPRFVCSRSILVRTTSLLAICPETSLSSSMASRGITIRQRIPHRATTRSGLSQRSPTCSGAPWFLRASDSQFQNFILAWPADPAGPPRSVAPRESSGAGW